MVEDDVVGPAQPAAEVAVPVQHLHRPRSEVDPLDPAARIVVGRAVRQQHPVGFEPAEPAIVAAIELAVRAHRQAVRAAPFRDRLSVSGRTRVMRPAAISTRMTLPWPSPRAFGKRNPSVTSPGPTSPGRLIPGLRNGQHGRRGAKEGDLDEIQPSPACGRGCLSSTTAAIETFADHLFASCPQRSGVVGSTLARTPLRSPRLPNSATWQSSQIAH